MYVGFLVLHFYLKKIYNCSRLRRQGLSTVSTENTAALSLELPGGFRIRKAIKEDCSSIIKLLQVTSPSFMHPDILSINKCESIIKCKFDKELANSLNTPDSPQLQAAGNFLVINLSSAFTIEQVSQLKADR